MINAERIGVISTIVKNEPGLGKTAIMKILFILQKVYKLPMNYEFSIYTYGPYSAEVMEDVDCAAHEDIISVSIMPYPNGITGYAINESKNIDKYILGNSLVTEYINSINEVTGMFGKKPAKELELDSTIIYVYDLHKKNKWECTEDNIINDVKEIKPHFDIEHIKGNYYGLSKLLGMLN
ncbi:MAG: hypothetical protein BGN88_05650 [Clostridiales bacterium 43-6]|nr:MAG: hypothetical protein BGN88_05650 [Clostridiales bacterium 43-6]